MSASGSPASPVGMLFATARSVPGAVVRAVLAALLRQVAFLALPWFFARGLAEGIGRGDPAATLAWGGATLGAALVQWFAMTRWQRWSNVADAASGAWLRSVLLSHVVRLAADALPAGDGDLLARATRDVLSIRRWVHGLGSWAAVAVTAAVVVPGLAAIDPRLLLTALACIPVLVAVNLFLPRRVQRASTDLTRAHGRRTAAVAELLTSPVAVRGVGGETELLRRHHAASRDLATATRRAGATMATWTALTTGIPALATAIGLGVGAAVALDGRLSVADLTVFVTWMGTVGIAVEVAVDRIAATVEARVAAGRLLEVLDTAPQVGDPADPAPLPERGTLQLIGVSLPRNGRGVFTPPDLAIGAGEFVVVTGPTGCGKSTLLELLARHRDPDRGRGRVTLAGTDLRTAALTDVRQRLVLLPQRPARLSGTLRQILTLGRAVTDDDVLTACAAAGWELDPGLLEARVGSGATTFSGGQWQRLAVARALLARPAVLLLDDPTSAVDEATEQRTLQGIRAALPEATLVVVSHRPAVLAAAGRVVELAPPVAVPASLQGVS